MKIAFANLALPATGTVVVGMTADCAMTPSAKGIDDKMSNGLTKALKAGRFKGAKGESLTLHAPAGTKLARVVVVGLGEAAALDALAWRDVGGRVVANLLIVADGDVSFMLDPVEGSKLAGAQIAAEVAYGAKLRSYRFDKYRTREKKDTKPSLKTFRVLSKSAAKSRNAFDEKTKIADGVFLTRDLVSEPANALFPKEFAARARELAKLGVKVDVMGEKQMEKLGMGALLGVGQGSARESQMVVMHWDGTGAAKGGKSNANAPVAFVGKGVCFDSGGISIKPSGGMEDMKWDMGGAGVVVGLMKALAGRKAKANVVGVVGLVENMPSGTAQRPGDVVTSMSGQTIEVLNTDAEGRLVLADALWYCKEKYKPRAIIDLATLTGAIIVCLGNRYAGLFSNNEELAEKLLRSSKNEGEGLWRMPLGEEYDKKIDSDIADMKNIGDGKGAGSITAAQFLKRFVDDVPWAHLDIAGVTWSSKDTATAPKGGTGFGVRLLERLVRDNYEG